MVRPFLKWPGGKRWLALRIRNQVNIPTGASYFEPFLGSGALFFSLLPERAFLCDINPALIDTYTALKQRPGLVRRYLSSWRNEEEVYYRVRATRFRSLYRRAAQFIYLNRTCWGGLYRVNQKGQFNVPFSGCKDRPTVPDSLSAAALSLQKSKLVAGDFEDCLSEARPHDVVYLDPPYIADIEKNNFRRYNPTVFSWNDQNRLAAIARNLARRGCLVIASGTLDPRLLEIYSGFHVQVLSRSNSLSPRENRSHRSLEVVFSSAPLFPHRIVSCSSTISVL